MPSQVVALEVTLAAIGDRLGPDREALRAAARGLAAAVDELPTRATLWTEYRAVLDTLFEQAGEVADDGQASLLRLVSTPMGHEEESGKADVRAGSSGNRPGVGAALDALAEAGS